MNTILIIAFCAMGFMLPTLFCAGFYYGFKTAEDVFCSQTVTKENIPGRETAETVKEAVAVKFRPAETDAQRQARILAENVENFGTDIPQQEVR